LSAARALRIGVLTPHAAVGPEAEFPAMAPDRLVTCVVRVSTDGPGNSSPTPAQGLRALTLSPVLDDAAEILAAGSIDVVGYASTTSAYAIGFDAEAAMVSRLSALLGVPVAATCAAAVRALHVLGIERVALIGAPWFETELNELGAAYFRGQGFDVVSSESAGLSQAPDRIEPATVHEWTSRHVADDAQAVFIGGNGFRAAGAVQRLEEALGRPVLTSNQVLLWNLLGHVHAAFTVNGYGRLFAQDAPGPGAETNEH
jgi:maleate isomerase